MDANTLNAKIDQLALVKAKEQVVFMTNQLQNAFDTGHIVTDADGRRHDFRSTFIAVAKKWIFYVEQGRSGVSAESHKCEDLESHFRSSILYELLHKLPLVK